VRDFDGGACLKEPFTKNNLRGGVNTGTRGGGEIVVFRLPVSKHRGNSRRILSVSEYRGSYGLGREETGKLRSMKKTKVEKIGQVETFRCETTGSQMLAGGMRKLQRKSRHVLP